jgi:hypothetical protein
MLRDVEDHVQNMKLKGFPNITQNPLNRKRKKQSGLRSQDHLIEVVEVVMAELRARLWRSWWRSFVLSCGGRGCVRRRGCEAVVT